MSCNRAMTPSALSNRAAGFLSYGQPRGKGHVQAAAAGNESVQRRCWVNKRNVATAAKIKEIRNQAFAAGVRLPSALTRFATAREKKRAANARKK